MDTNSQTLNAHRPDYEIGSLTVNRTPVGSGRLFWGREMPDVFPCHPDSVGICLAGWVNEIASNRLGVFPAHDVHDVVCVPVLSVLTVRADVDIPHGIRAGVSGAAHDVTSSCAALMPLTRLGPNLHPLRKSDPPFNAPALRSTLLMRIALRWTANRPERTVPVEIERLIQSAPVDALRISFDNRGIFSGRHDVDLSLHSSRMKLATRHFVKKPNSKVRQNHRATGLARGDHRYNCNSLSHFTGRVTRFLFHVIPVHRDPLARVGSAFLRVPSAVDISIAHGTPRLSVDGRTQFRVRRFVAVGDLHQAAEGRAASFAKSLALIARQSGEKSVKVHDCNLDVSNHSVKKHLNHALEISCSNVGMDIFENRRRWLAHWIKTDFDGDRKRAEEATGYSRSQLSQFLSPNYQGGESPQEKAARKLELKFGKAPRIMETPAPGTEGNGGMVPGPTIDVQPSVTADQSVPDYVSDAISAVRDAHKASVPREVFDAVRILFSLLNRQNNGNIDASHKDETLTATAAMQSLKRQADQVQQEAEERLATRSGGSRGARKVGERRSKNIRH